MRTDTAKVEQLLAGHAGSVQQIVYGLRRIVEATIPDVVEEVDLDDGSITYTDGEPILSIEPGEEAVDLFFFHGSLLSDPGNLLEEDADTVRILRFTSPYEVESGDVMSMVHEAAIVHRQ